MDFYVDRNQGSNVTGNGTQAAPWETISFALSQISGANHTVHIAAGVYDRTASSEGWSEIFPIHIKNGISLVGASTDTALIDAVNSANAILIKDVSNGSVTIENFSIKCGNPAGIKCENSNVTIRNCYIFENNTKGLSVSNSSNSYSLLLENNKINDNHGYGLDLARGIYFISKNEINNNDATGFWSNSYGIYSSGGILYIINNIIQDNSSSHEHGYGLNFYNCKKVEIRQNLVKGNKGIISTHPEGYGLSVSADSSIIVDNEVEANYGEAGISCSGEYTRIDSNFVSQNRIGIDIKSKDSSVGHNVIFNNHLTGLYVNSNQTSQIHYNEIFSNAGYGIQTSSGKVTLTRNEIYNNANYGIKLSGSDSPLVYQNALYENNGGISLGDSGSIIYNNIFANNQKYAINETGIEADPFSCRYNLFFKNTNVYFDEGQFVYPNLIMTETFVPECSNNLAGDPLFIDTENNDFHLQANSPAINAGDPDSPSDPDGTRADIGVHYYPNPTRPEISSLTPILGTSDGGTTVTINGNNFEDIQGQGQVTFGDTEAAYYTSWSNTQIICVTPKHTAGLVDVMVTANSGLTGTKTFAFTFGNPPMIIPLRTGWNWISWNINPANDSADVLLRDIKKNASVVLGFKQGGQTYDPTLPQFNDLLVMDFRLGYQIMMDKPDTLSVSGISVESPYPAIPLYQRWNWIAYLPSQADSITQALAGIYDNLAVVLGYGGQVHDPLLPQFNTLHVLEPGNMYELYMNIEMDLIYPSTTAIPSANRTASLNYKTRSQEKVPISNEWIAIYGQDLEFNGQLLAVGTHLSIKDPEGNICGSATIKEPGMLKFTPIFRDDSRTAVDEGAQPGDALHLFVGNKEIQTNITWTTHGDCIALTNLVLAEPADRNELPLFFKLHHNYPNPFNQVTVITYELPGVATVFFDFYNITGEHIATLVLGKKSAGRNQFTWQATQHRGNELSSGIYFYRMKATSAVGTFVDIKRMVLIR